MLACRTARRQATGFQVRTFVAKWIFGSVAFVSPAVIAAIGQRLDRSAYRHDATYQALIPVFAWGALGLAVVVPAILLLRSHAPVWRRVSYLIGVWCL